MNKNKEIKESNVIIAIICMLLISILVISVININNNNNTEESVITSMKFQAYIDKAIKSEAETIKDSDNKLIVEYENGIEYVFTVNTYRNSIQSVIRGPEDVITDRLNDILSISLKHLSSSEIKGITEQLISDGQVTIMHGQIVFKLDYTGDSLTIFCE